MPMPEPTVPVSFRMPPAEFIAFAEKARAEGLNRSDLLRRLIAQAVASTPQQEQAA